MPISTPMSVSGNMNSIAPTQSFIPSPKRFLKSRTEVVLHQTRALQCAGLRRMATSERGPEPGASAILTVISRPRSENRRRRTLRHFRRCNCLVHTTAPAAPPRCYVAGMELVEAERLLLGSPDYRVL